MRETDRERGWQGETDFSGCSTSSEQQGSLFDFSVFNMLPTITITVKLLIE